MNVQELKNRMVLRARDSLASYTQLVDGSTVGIDVFELNALFQMDVLKELLLSADHKSVIKLKKVSLETCEDGLTKEYLQDKFDHYCKASNDRKGKFSEWIAAEQSNRISRLKTILSKSKEMIRETGVDCLKIGFPYVTGKFIDQNNEMDIYRAPLFLCGIEMEINKTFNGINLILKNDLQLNTVLGEKFVHYGAPSLDLEMMDNMTDSFSELYVNKKSEKAFAFFWNKTCELIEQAVLKPLSLKLSDYKVAGIKGLCRPFEKLIIKRSDLDEKKFEDNPLVKKHVVIGLFRLNSQEIINDLNQWKDGDKYLSSLEKTKLNLFDPINYDYKESDVVQIDELDNSQKFAILKALNENCVIYGPPGTGKSATITNLLVNVMHKQKQAVFCAEKKVATDVVYNRLDRYQTFTLMIHDLVKDKQSFYTQLRKNVDQMRNWFGVNKLRLDAIEEYNSAIDEIFKQAQNAQKLLQSVAGQDYIKCLRKHALPNSYKKETSSWIKQHSLFQIDDAATIPDLLRRLIDLRHQYQDYLTIPSNYNLVLERFKHIQEVTQFDWEHAVDANMSATYFIKTGKLRLKLGWLAKKQCKKSKLIDNDLNQQIGYVKSHKNMLNKMALLSDENNIELMKELNGFRDDDFLTLLERCLIINFEKAHQKLLLFAASDWQNQLQNLLAQKMRLEKEAWPMHYGTAIIKELKTKCDQDEEFRARYNNFYKTLTQTQRLRSVKIFYNQYQDIIQLLCPVLICSIDTAVGLFPLAEKTIDYVIFDEASQIYLERAMTLCYRAKLVSVAGDDQQLQPTNFFIKDLDGDDEWADSEAWYQPGDFVSLLNLAKHIFNDYRLTYHYRAQYIELIYFSNLNFYNSQLLVCNTNKREANYQPIEIVKVNGKWENQVNEEEANKIVELIIHLVDEHNGPDLPSIGVITFNKKQAELIMRRLIKASASNQQLDLTMNNPDLTRILFVKNLEDVQGEERDIILFSFAFAYNKKNGFSRNFGPINKNNGEFRINVAISRARLKIYIICSILSSDILRDASLSMGAKTLGRYLKYCELLQTNRFDQPIIKTLFPSIITPDDKKATNSRENVNFLSDEVYEALLGFLDANRYQVQRNLAQAGLVIDLAIWDKINQCYVLAINCDQYRIDETIPAKARDYYLQAMLVNKGWTYIKVDAIWWWHENHQVILDLIMKKIIK